MRASTFYKVVRELEAAKKKYNAALKKFRKTCRHEHVVECDYKRSVSGYFNGLPPMRVCKLCGLDEEAWPTGYGRLQHAVVDHVSRDEANSFRRFPEGEE